jgi:hypothetical protein
MYFESRQSVADLAIAVGYKVLLHKGWAMQNRILRPSPIEEYIYQAQSIPVKRKCA